MIDVTNLISHFNKCNQSIGVKSPRIHTLSNIRKNELHFNCFCLVYELKKYPQKSKILLPTEDV